MLHATLYRTRIWLAYLWGHINHWKSFSPHYADDWTDYDRWQRQIARLLYDLDIHFFNIYGQEQASAQRKELVKKLIWKKK